MRVLFRLFITFGWVLLFPNQYLRGQSIFTAKEAPLEVHMAVVPSNKDDSAVVVVTIQNCDKVKPLSNIQIKLFSKERNLSREPAKDLSGQLAKREFLYEGQFWTTLLPIGATSTLVIIYHLGDKPTNENENSIGLPVSFPEQSSSKVSLFLDRHGNSLIPGIITGIVSVLGIVLGIVGTLLGNYFGIQWKASEEARKEEEQKRALLHESVRSFREELHDIGTVPTLVRAFRRLEQNIRAQPVPPPILEKFKDATEENGQRTSGAVPSKKLDNLKGAVEEWLAKQDTKAS